MKFKLNQAITIRRRFISLALIIVFAFAVTPSVLFHNLLANHTDETIQHRHTKNHEVAAAGINCHWDNLVCEGSFLNNFSQIVIDPPIPGGLTFITPYQTFFSQYHFYTALRGPPSLS